MMGCGSQDAEPEVVRVEKPAAIPVEEPAAEVAAVPHKVAKPAEPYVPQPLPTPGEKPVLPVTDPDAPAPAEAETADAASAPPLPSEPVFEPLVALTQDHAASTKVGIGDMFPELSLVDLDGNEQSLAELSGAKLTFILFWDDQHVYAQEQFSRLPREIIGPFAGHGVRAVAVYVGNQPEKVRELRDEFGVNCLCLIDPDGSALDQLATEHLPRSYLVDAQGRVVWHDLEYSQSTRKNLRNAILYYLTQGKGAA